MLIAPRVLSLITTRRCTAECDHCCIGSSPRETEAIPIERMHGLIDEAKRIPSIERVTFTGGECFLLGRDLDALIAHAHELGLHTRVITNGYWAVNEAAARSRVAALKRAGLQEMMLSTGTFHQAFVPVGRVINAGRAAAAIRIPTRISIEVCDQQTFDESILERELAEEIATRRVFLGHDPWTTDAALRGTSRITHDTLPTHFTERSMGACHQILDVVTVSPDQRLLACCGFPMEQLPALEMGSVRSTRLDEALIDAPVQLLHLLLRAWGPQRIAAFVAEFIPSYTIPAGITICDACVSLQKDANALTVIREHAMQLVPDLIATCTAPIIAPAVTP